MGQIKSGALLSYATVAFTLLAGLFYTPWMIKCIGTTDYALYTLSLSIIGFFMMDFGLSDAVARFLSKFYAEGHEERVAGFLGMAYKAYFILDGVICIVLIIVFFNIDLIYSTLGKDSLETFKGLFLIVSLYSIISFPAVTLSGTLRANEKFVPLYGCNLAEKVSNVLLIVFALLAGFGVFALVLVNACTSLVFIVAKYYFVKKATKAKADFYVWDQGMLREIIGFSLWVTISQVCQRLIFSIMPSIIAITSTTWEVSLFGLASSLEGYVYSVATALNGLFMPKVSRALVSQGANELQEMMSRFGRIQLYVVGFLFVCLVALGRDFINCWVGGEYMVLWPCAALLVLPGVVELSQFIASTAVIASNNVKLRAFVYGFMAVVNVVLGFFLTSRLGAFGGCISICIAYCIRTFGMNLIYRNKLHLSLSFFFKKTFLPWAIPAVSTGTIALTLSLFNPIRGWLGLVIEGVVALAAYGILLWLLMFNDYEKKLFVGSFARALKKGDKLC